MDLELSQELLELQGEDRRVRERLAADGSLFDGYNAEMERVHHRNAARLRELVADHGWPDRALVTDDAAGAAWTILQHSIGEPEFMRHGLELVKESAARGQTPAVEVAMLEDRIATFEGRPQPTLQSGVGRPRRGLARSAGAIDERVFVRNLRTFLEHGIDGNRLVT